MGVSQRRPDVTTLRRLLDYDPLSGVFTWRVDRMCGRYGKQFAAKAGDRAGSVGTDGRVQLRVAGYNGKAHVIAWALMEGRWPTFEIDHRDTDPSNNRWVNLRPADRRLNNQNRRKAKRSNTSGVLGVTARRNGRFIAQITVDGRNKYIGSFRSAVEAHAAYLVEKRLHHEGCTL